MEVLYVAIGIVGFILGYLLSKAIQATPTVKQSRLADKTTVDTCRMFDSCGSFVNPTCVSGHCNAHCRAYCQCGAAGGTSKKDQWAEILED